jgi:hypothetical protein
MLGTMQVWFAKTLIWRDFNSFTNHPKNLSDKVLRCFCSCWVCFGDPFPLDVTSHWSSRLVTACKCRCDRCKLLGSGVQIIVTEQNLDIAQVGARFQQVGGPKLPTLAYIVSSGDWRIIKATLHRDQARPQGSFLNRNKIVENLSALSVCLSF